MKISESAVRIAIRPVIKALIAVITNKELGEYMDKEKMEDSAVEQIVQKLKELE